jgi:hypothetical protein
MNNQKNRWWLAASLVFSLGLTHLALAQEGKTGGMEGEHMMEQKGDAMKDRGAMKDARLAITVEPLMNVTEHADFKGERAAT